MHRVTFPCRQLCTQHEYRALSRKGKFFQHLQKQGKARQSGCYEEADGGCQRPEKLSRYNLSCPTRTAHRPLRPASDPVSLSWAGRDIQSPAFSPVPGIPSCPTCRTVTSSLAADFHSFCLVYKLHEEGACSSVIQVKSTDLQIYSDLQICARARVVQEAVASVDSGFFLW